MMVIIHAFAVLAWIGIGLIMLSFMSHDMQAVLSNRWRQYFASKVEKHNLPFDSAHDVYNKRERTQRRIARSRELANYAWQGVNIIGGGYLALGVLALFASDPTARYTFGEFLNDMGRLSLIYAASWLVYLARMWWLDQVEMITSWNNTDITQPYDPERDYRREHDEFEGDDEFDDEDWE